MGLHVLFLYAFNRIAAIMEFDEAVYEEIQRRTASIPPAQRQAAIDAMVKDRKAIGTQAVLRKRAEEKARKKSYWLVYLVLLVISFMIYLWCSGGIH